MFGIGPTELIVLLVIALIVVGPEKLPQLAGQIGKAIRDFRQMSGDVTGEFQRAFQLDEPPAEQRPFLVGDTNTATASTNGVAEHSQELAAQVIPSDPPLESVPVAEEATEASSATEIAPVATDYSTLSTPPLATKDEPLAGVSMLDEPEPAPTAYQSQGITTLAPRQMTVAEATGMTAIADAWNAVETTDATISLPEPTAEELAVAASTAVALVEPEQEASANGTPTEVSAAISVEEEQRPRVDPNAEVTIREVIEAQVAAEAFRERRRIATYRRHK